MNCITRVSVSYSTKLAKRALKYIEDMVCATFMFIPALRIAPATESLVLEEVPHEIERSIDDRCVTLDLYGKHLEQRLSIGDG